MLPEPHAACLADPRPADANEPPPDQDQAYGYGRLVGDGHYAAAPSGLRGKFDNVRRVWENQITRFAVRSALERLTAGGSALRIMDLGCGSGEGWDLLLRVPAVGAARRPVLTLDQIATYHGIDLCAEMVAEARIRFQDRPQASFACGDLNDPAAFLADQPGFDLYYNSYGSLSHIDDAGLHRLVAAIARHQPGPCAVVVDVHGQFSPEWPGYWNYSRTASMPRMQPYNMVWMYPESERAERLAEQAGYRVRYWRGEELRQALLAVPGIAGRVRHLELIDRSVWVGRHVDTACFHPQARPIRRQVNRLFEYNLAAKAEGLMPYDLPESGDPTVDGFFAEFSAAWRAVVEWFFQLQHGGRASHPLRLCHPLGPVPPVMLPGLNALAQQVAQQSWFEPGDPEANLLQPQLGLLLRQLEYHSQRGLGCGHGLIAVLELAPAER